MARKKIAIDIKLDLLGECNKKDLDRLLSKPINLKPKDYLYTAKRTVEVVDPAWTPKGFKRNLYNSVRRHMQILAARADDGLKKFDKESNPMKQVAAIGKLKNKIAKSAKEISGQADANLKQIIEEATKDTTKWDKARDAKNSMSEVDNGHKDLEKAVQKLEDSLVAVSKNIEKAKVKEGPDRVEKLKQGMEKKRKKFQIKKSDDLEDFDEELKAIQVKKEGITKKIEDIDKKGASKDDLANVAKQRDNLVDVVKQRANLEKRTMRKKRDFVSEEKEMEEELDQNIKNAQKDLDKEIKDYSKDALDAFTTYRQGRKGFNDTLKKTLNMSKLIDQKNRDSKVMAQLHDMLKKKVRPAAEGYRKYLDDCDNDIIAVVKNMGDRKVTEDQIKKSMPDLNSGKAAVLFKEFKAVQGLMKREKIK